MNAREFTTLVAFAICTVSCVPVLLPGPRAIPDHQNNNYPNIISLAINQNDPYLPYNRLRSRKTLKELQDPLIENNNHHDIRLVKDEVYESNSFKWRLRLPYGIKTTLFEGSNHILVSTYHNHEDNYNILTKHQKIYYLINKISGKIVWNFSCKISDGDHYENGFLYILSRDMNTSTPIQILTIKIHD